MGLDAYLYNFKGVDTNAIVELSRFSDEPWAYEHWNKWKLLTDEEKHAHGPIPSPAEVQEYQSKLTAKARELGLPEHVATSPCYGGVKVCFPSKKYPDSGLFVGDWDPVCFWVHSLLLKFGHKNLYYIFPEAIGDPHYIAPDWVAARERITELVLEIQKKGQYLADIHDTDFETGLQSLGIVIETIDYVLSQPNPKEYMLYWST